MNHTAALGDVSLHLNCHLKRWQKHGDTVSQVLQMYISCCTKEECGCNTFL